MCVWLCERESERERKREIEKERKAAQIEMYMFSPSQSALMIEELGSTCVSLQVSPHIFFIRADNILCQPPLA